MRRLPLVILLTALVAPAPAFGQAPPAGATAPAPAPGPRSRAVAIPIEILSPVGGAGCFYQRRILSGVLVTAGSLIAGGAMLWGITHADRDVTIINAVAYGVLRGAGVFLAAQPTAVLPASGSIPPAPPPARSAQIVGLWPRFSF